MHQVWSSRPHHDTWCMSSKGKAFTWQSLFKVQERSSRNRRLLDGFSDTATARSS
jgi:hypothetical protein